MKLFRDAVPLRQHFIIQDFQALNLVLRPVQPPLDSIDQDHPDRFLLLQSAMSSYQPNRACTPDGNVVPLFDTSIDNSVIRRAEDVTQIESLLIRYIVQKWKKIDVSKWYTDVLRLVAYTIELAE